MTPTIDGFLETLVERIATRVAERLSTDAPRGKDPAAGVPQPDFYSEADLAKRTGLSQRTLQGWRSKGSGPQWTKVGRRVLYPRPDAETFFQGHGNGHPTPARHRSKRCSP
jgi:hypothetical protein